MNRKERNSDSIPGDVVLPIVLKIANNSKMVLDRENVTVDH